MATNKVIVEFAIVINCVRVPAALVGGGVHSGGRLVVTFVMLRIVSTMVTTVAFILVIVATMLAEAAGNSRPSSGLAQP